MKHLLSLGFSALMALGASASPDAITKAITNPKPVNMWELASKQWPKSENTNKKHFRTVDRGTMVTQPDMFTGQGEYYGPLDAPDGSEWDYVADFKTNPRTGYYDSAHITVYDSKGNTVGDFNAEWELAPGDVGVNFVQVAPCITQKFFNYDSNYELMVYVHAVTEDYTGHNFMQVYSLETGEFVQTVEGLQVDAANLATDPWSENFILLFQRESIDYDAGKYLLHYDVYTRAGWGSGARKVHTFDIDYELFAGSGDNALPILLQAHNGKAYFALPHYEIPFFDPEIPWTQEPVVLPGNKFIVDLYEGVFQISNTNVEKIHSTVMPMYGNDGYLYTFPLMGGMLYQDDLSFGLFDAPVPEVMENAPALIVTFEKYRQNTDNYVQDFVVYDLNGNELKTIATDVDAFRELSPIPGEERQICFMDADEYTGEVIFRMLNLPSVTTECEIPVVFGDNNLTEEIDRVEAEGGYKYVSSMYAADVDNEGNILHCVAWVNRDGTLDRIDRVKLGKNIALAQVCVSPTMLNPYLFDTDEEMEYLFLVKEYINPGVSSASTEKLWALNVAGEKSLEFQPFEEDGVKWDLNNIWLNGSGSDAKLVVVWKTANGWRYRFSYTSLPLSCFAGGDGTEQNPYLIATVGDFRQIESAPAASYSVIADLDFGGSLFSGLNVAFTGHLEGNNHTISGLNINGHGLFESIVGKAKVENLYIVDPVFVPQGTAGLLAGEVTADDEGVPMVANIHVSGLTVSGDNDDTVGGLVGNLSVSGSKIEACSVTDAVVDLPEAQFGGIVGSIRSGANVNACYFSGLANAMSIGGICQNGVGSEATITNCHVDADLTGQRWVGGVLAESPARASVFNCYVQGTLTASTKNYDPAIGGVIGELGTVNDDRSNFAIRNCVVALDAINAPEGAISAHRIVGHTSDIDHAIDPQVPMENAIGPNYVVEGLAVIDSNYEDDSMSCEGKTISLDEVTADFMTSLGYNAGQDASSPWIHTDGSHSSLWFENGVRGLEVSDETLSIVEGESATLTFTVIGGDASAISYEVSDDQVVAVEEVSREGSVLTLKVTCLQPASTVITATAGNFTASCVITGLSGIALPGVDANVTVEGYYNLQGVRSDRPVEGVNIVRFSDGSVRKIVVR